mmetsp:Transcript_50835/g.147572  ORF Transcript_50835/g.147572 Transcript_50835/m.147572 type:complete len:219 (+) Transcript_50835:52-708(+)
MKTSVAGGWREVSAVAPATGQACRRKCQSLSASASARSMTVRRSSVPSSALTCRGPRPSCPTWWVTQGSTRIRKSSRSMHRSGAMTDSRSSRADTSRQRQAASMPTSNLCLRPSARGSLTTPGKVTTAASLPTGKRELARAIPWLATAPTEASCQSRVRRSSGALRPTLTPTSHTRSRLPWLRSTMNRFRTCSSPRGRGRRKAWKSVNHSSLASTLPV